MIARRVGKGNLNNYWYEMFKCLAAELQKYRIKFPLICRFNYKILYSKCIELISFICPQENQMLR